MTASGPPPGVSFSAWVAQIQAQHSGAAAATPFPSSTTTTNDTDDLENEIRQSRLDRQKRRSRLSGAGVRGITPTSPPADDHPEPTYDPSPTMLSQRTGETPASPAAAATPQRGAALLARYGGALGPTGVAATSSSGPTSLASFMGGKAAGPRLGKLAGDGRSAPPEAAADDFSTDRRYALPGMVKASANGTSPVKEGGLAGFMERRKREMESASIPPSLNTAAANKSPSSTGFKLPSPTRPSPTRSTTFGNPASPIRASPVFPPSDTASQPALRRRETSETGTSPIRFEEAPIEMVGADSSSHLVVTGAIREIAPSPSFKSPSSPFKAAPTLPSPSASPASPAFSATTVPTSTDKAPSASLTRLRGQKVVGQRIREAMEREKASEDSGSVPSSPALAGAPAGRVQGGNAGVKARWNPSPEARSPVKEEPPKPAFVPGRFGKALPGMAPRSASPERKAATPSWRPSQEEEEVRAPPVRLPGMGGAKSPFEDMERRKEEALAAKTEEEKVLVPLTANRARGPKRSTPAATATPTVSKLLNTEQDTFHPIRPSDRLAGSLAEKRSVREVESELREKTAEEGKETVVKEPVVNDPTAVKPASPPRSTTGKSIVVLISGSGSNLQALIDATCDGRLPNATITFVLSNRKAAYGLERAATSNPPIPTSVLSLKTWQNKTGGTREEYDEVLAERVLSKGVPDLIVLAGFMHIVSPQFLRALGHWTGLDAKQAPSWAPRRAVPIINLHPALPGAFDGAHAIERAYEAFQKGEIQHTGVMVHKVIAEVDRGAPVIVRNVEIKKGEAVEALEERMHAVEHEIIVEGARKVLEGGTEEDVGLDGPKETEPLPNPWESAAAKKALEGAGQGDSSSAAPVNDQPQFQSVRSSIASWGQQPTTTTTTPPVTTARPRRRTLSRPTSMYGGAKSSLDDVAEAPGDVSTADKEVRPRSRVSSNAARPTTMYAGAAPRLKTEVPGESSAGVSPVSPATTRRIEEQARALEDLVRGTPATIKLPLSPVTPNKSFDGRAFAAQHFARLAASKQRPSTRTLSLEVLSIQSDGSTLAVPPSESYNLYSTECLAVVERSKGEDGLVYTSLHAWIGKDSPAYTDGSSKEAAKLMDLAKRYSTILNDARYGRESTDLVRKLGGLIVNRKGSRKRWDEMSTAMYEVREIEGVTIADEVDLTTSSLCSAFSYVPSLLGDFSVWHGRGSPVSQRSAAFALACKFKGLSAGEADATDLPREEEEGRESKTFWNVFDRSVPYASASHHAAPLPVVASNKTIVLSVVEGKGDVKAPPNIVAAHSSSSTASSSHLSAEGVSIVVLPREVFVVVGDGARGERGLIGTALQGGEAIAEYGKEVGGRRPVHVVIYPSVTPRELRAALRAFDDEHLLSAAGGRRDKPAFMNVVELKTAWKELGCNEWEMGSVEDEDWLPLGVSPQVVREARGGKEI